MKKSIQLLLALFIAGLVLTGCRSIPPPGAPLTDSELAVAVMTRLDEDPVTAPYDFGVTVIDGVVYLRGSAPPSNAIRARAVSIALGTSGVLEVVDDLYPPTSGMY